MPSRRHISRGRCRHSHSTGRSRDHLWHREHLPLLHPFCLIWTAPRSTKAMLRSTLPASRHFRNRIRGGFWSSLQAELRSTSALVGLPRITRHRCLTRPSPRRSPCSSRTTICPQPEAFLIDTLHNSRLERQRWPCRLTCRPHAMNHAQQMLFSALHESERCEPKTPTGRGQLHLRYTENLLRALHTEFGVRVLGGNLLPCREIPGA